MKEDEDLAVGRIIAVDDIPLVDDSNWWPEADYLETGRVIPFGSINVFVGFISGRSVSSVQEGDSAEEVADDGEESVESMDSQEFGSIIPAFEESYWDYAPVPEAHELGSIWPEGQVCQELQEKPKDRHPPATRYLSRCRP